MNFVDMLPAPRGGEWARQYSRETQLRDLNKAHAGFLMNVVAFNQTDLAYWNGVSGQVISIAQTPQNEHFEGSFSNGVIIYSMAVPPKTTTDLFEWRAGQTTRMTDGTASHSLVRILRGDF